MSRTEVLDTPTKPSGIPWLGEVPAHWEVKRLKDIADVRFSNVDKKTEEGEIPVRLCNYTDVYYGHYLDGTPEYMEATATRSEIERFKLRKGDVLITKDSESPTDIAIAAMVVEDVPDLVCGYHLAMIRVDQEQLDPAFLYWQFLSDQVREQYYPLANGITRFALGHGEINGGAFVVPPLPEQRAIAAFLDERTARIDALVARKRRLVQLLKEKRQALITRAVTRGLDPQAKMKESGVPWLGEVPEHWSLPALNSRYEILLGKMLDEKRLTKTELVPYLRNIDVQWDRVNTEDLHEMDIAPNEYERFTLRPGDLLVCEGGDIGRTATWRGELALCAFQKAVHRVRPRSASEHPRYLFYTMVSVHGRGVFLAEGNPNTIPHLTGEKFRRYRFPQPPHEEQVAIAEHLDQMTTRIDALVTKVEAAVERLQEYRTALISAAVTGKVLVPNT